MALAGDAGAHDFGQAVDVDRLDAEPLLEIAAHRIAPRLRSEQAGPQGQAAEIDAHAGGDLRDIQRVGRCGAQHVGFEVLQQNDLPLGHAAGNRHHGAAEPLGAVMRAEAAGEEPIAVSVVDDVARQRAGGGERSRHEIRPAIEIALGITDHRRLAGCSRRGVNTQDIFSRHREHAEGVIFAKVRLQREWKTRDIGRRFQIGRRHLRGVEFLAVMRHMGISPLEGLSQTGRLQLAERRPRHRLDIGIEHENFRAPDRRCFAHDSISISSQAFTVDHPGLTAGPAMPTPRTGVCFSAKP